MQAREEIKSPWRWCARHDGKSIKPRSHQMCSFRKRFKDGIGLFLPELIALFPFDRWADHTIHTDLSTNGRAKADTDHLVQQCHRLVRDIDAFEVSASSTTFTGNTL